MTVPPGPGPDVPPSTLAKRAAQENWAQWSLKRGLQNLPEALEERMRNGGCVEVHRDTPVTGLSTNGTGWEVRLLETWGLRHMYVYCHCTGVVVVYAFLSCLLN